MMIMGYQSYIMNYNEMIHIHIYTYKIIYEINLVNPAIKKAFSELEFGDGLLLALPHE